MPLSDTLRNVKAVTAEAKRAAREVAKIGSPSVSSGGAGSTGSDTTALAVTVARIDRQTRRGDTFQQRARKLGLG